MNTLWGSRKTTEKEIVKRQLNSIEMVEKIQRSF